jgi:hypothetical protein
MLPGLCNFRPVTPTRIGTVAFFICIAGTIASVPLLLLARAAAGTGGYAVMLVDPRYQWAGVMVTVSTVMEAVGFGAIAYLLRVFSRVGAWLAFVALLLASIIVAVANSMELWNSFLSQNNATVAAMRLATQGVDLSQGLKPSSRSSPGRIGSDLSLCRTSISFA